MEKSRVKKISTEITRSGLRKKNSFSYLMQNVANFTTDELFDRLVSLCLSKEIDVEYLLENSDLEESEKRKLVMACMCPY
jgi:hypothetical protein